MEHNRKKYVTLIIPKEAPDRDNLYLFLTKSNNDSQNPHESGGFHLNQTPPLGQQHRSTHETQQKEMSYIDNS